MKNKQVVMRAQLQEVFPDKNLVLDNNGCLITDNRPILYIDDDEVTQQTYFLKDEAVNDKKQYFEIENKSKKQIDMLLLDGCMYDDSADSRCDCVVFDDTFWCYTELKLRVQATTPNKTRKIRWAKAEEQLEKTIGHFDSIFKEKGKSFLDYQKEAFIIMKKNAYPTNTAEFKAKKLKFLLRNGMPLISSNKKKFD